MDIKDRLKQGLEFLPIILILVYKIVVETCSLSHTAKMTLLYSFIGISTVVFAYLWFSKDKGTKMGGKTAIVLFSLIFIVGVLLFFKK